MNISCFLILLLINLIAVVKLFVFNKGLLTNQIQISMKTLQKLLNSNILSFLSNRKPKTVKKAPSNFVVLSTLWFYCKATLIKADGGQNLKIDTFPYSNFHPLICNRIGKSLQKPDISHKT